MWSSGRNFFYGTKTNILFENYQMPKIKQTNINISKILSLNLEIGRLLFYHVLTIPSILRQVGRVRSVGCDVRRYSRGRGFDPRSGHISFIEIWS